MTISLEKHAQILRHYHVDKWRVGTIANQLHIHHSVVTRILKTTGAPELETVKQGTLIEPYMEFIQKTLEKYPKLTASRLYGMVVERGYTGGPDHFRHIISLHRPKASPEAYLRLKTLAGEQGQVDWGHFGHIDVGKAHRPVMAFVMVLSYSRKIFLRFFLNQQQANFLRGHEQAFSSFAGIPRVLLYDNLKSVVLDRQGSAIQFHPNFLKFSAHYCFEPRPVAVARGNEKGRVERAIRYIRDNFFAGREWKDLDDLNQQAEQWCETQASNRPCPEDESKTVREMFEEERHKLIDLPDNPYPCEEKITVTARKTPYIRFDLNDYSLPHQYVQRDLTVIATLDTITIVDGMDKVAEHPRSYDKGQQIENEEHMQDLILWKKKARQHNGQHRLSQAVPSMVNFLNQAVERKYSLKSIVHQMNDLLDSYGSAELEIAVREALKKDVPHPNTVRLCLEKRREERHQPPPLAVELPDDKRLLTQAVRPHDLKKYDSLQDVTEDKENEK